MKPYGVTIPKTGVCDDHELAPKKRLHKNCDCGAHYKRRGQKRQTAVRKAVLRAPKRQARAAAKRQAADY